MLMDISNAKKLIEDNEILLISGEEEILKKLPAGKWVGGTIPYFMDKSGGLVSQDKVFCTALPDIIENIQIKWYDQETISNIGADAPENGFSYIIIPAESTTHITYAENAPNYKDIFLKPVVGWISGVLLSNIHKISPKVFNGETLNYSDKNAIVLHASIKKNKIATVNIINLFKQGSGDSIKFVENGFSVKDCYINDKKINFSNYLLENKIDIKYPLVADYFGTNVNVSFQKINENSQTVDFYAPVFYDVEYKIAKPLTDYVKEFNSRIKETDVNVVFSCNCILNFLYSELEGKKTGSLTGPITFGEIAHQLLNQTLVYLEILDN